MDDLNVFKTGYLPLTYWKNWFRNIKRFFFNIKCAWERATKGYCSDDVADLGRFYTKLIANSMEEKSKTVDYVPCNYLQFYKDDYVKAKCDWVNTIHQAALYMWHSDEDSTFHKNRFEEEFHNMMDNRETVVLEDGARYRVLKEEEEILSQKYWKEEEKVTALRRKDRAAALTMISDMMDAI